MFFTTSETFFRLAELLYEVDAMIRRIFLIICLFLAFILIFTGSFLKFSVHQGASLSQMIQCRTTAPGSSDPTKDEWPMFHGQLNHTGEAHTSSVSNNSPFWSYPTGGVVSSSPAVTGGRVYVGSEDGKIYCMNATTGVFCWNYTTMGAVSSSPAVAGGRVYVGSTDYKVDCLNATTGMLCWNYTTGAWVTSSPAVAGGRVYVGSYDHKIYCLNATTGGLLWSYTTGAWVTSSPAVAGGRVYVGSDDHKIYCLPMILNTTSITTTPIPGFTLGYLVLGLFLTINILIPLAFKRIDSSKIINF
jgi:hypothetical protein